MKNSNPTTELLRIEADDQKTHALLCAVMRARRKAEETGYMDHHLEAFKEWEETLHDTYFADRKRTTMTGETQDDEAQQNKHVGPCSTDGCTNMMWWTGEWGESVCEECEADE